MHIRIATFLLFTPALIYSADKMTPLHEAISRLETKEGKSDVAELGYVGLRCAALYDVLSAYIKTSAPDEETRKSSEELDKQARHFLKVTEVANVVIGKSVAETSKQFRILSDYYTNEMRENKLLNNSVFSESIKSDLAAAKKIYPLFLRLSEAYEKDH